MVNISVNIFISFHLSNLLIIFFKKSFVPESLLFVLHFVGFVAILVDESPGEANDESKIELFFIFFFLVSIPDADDDDDSDSELSSTRVSLIFNNDRPIMLLPLTRFLLLAGDRFV